MRRYLFKYLPMHATDFDNRTQKSSFLKTNPSTSKNGKVIDKHLPCAVWDITKDRFRLQGRSKTPDCRSIE
jgi:hypothetical protein